MRTSAELVSIQALSAELLASAVCCSSLASRAAVSVDGLGLTPPVCAQTTCANIRIKTAVTAVAISFSRMDTVGLFSRGPESRRGSPIDDASLYRPPFLRGNRNYLSCLSGFVIEFLGRARISDLRT